MQIPSNSFQKEHISTYSKYVGMPLNIRDANGNNYVPEDRREAQLIIKDAHRLIKEWTIRVKNRLFPNGTDPDRKIAATNQAGNFRDYLPQTIYPSKNSSQLLMYWFYLWADRSKDNKIYFRITLGLNEWKSTKKLEKKLEEIRAKYNIDSSMLDGYEGAQMTSDQLDDWAEEKIKNLELTYDEVKDLLEPELSENESKLLEEDKTKFNDDEEENLSFWIEKTQVRSNVDRITGDHALGKCLWSPQRSASDRRIYDNMLAVKPGDVIFHLIDKQSIVGVSIASAAADDKFICPNGTEWSGRAAYRIPLKEYIELNPRLDRKFIFNDKHSQALLEIREKYSDLFYTKNLTLAEGKYLTKAPEKLVDLFAKIYFDLAGKQLPYINFQDRQDMNDEEFMSNEEFLPYSNEDALDGLFISKEDFLESKELLKYKKNLILQGAPGTGKSFIAKRLAYALLGEKDPNRIASIQFHQSFSYEDFIQGYRPKKDSSGFHLQNGVFYTFCQKAMQDPSKDYVFIIDEINRGNLSKIFGEVMLLIESDKRGSDWAVKLTYSDENDSTFYIPSNVYVLGMMNTADRSLAIVDYALRRRFAFKDIKPGFDNEIFDQVLLAKGVSPNIIKTIKFNINELNRKIEASIDLGLGFLIGHSFFVPSENVSDSNEWYQRIIRNEIAPLLKEYWFDKKQSEVDQEIGLLKEIV